MSPRLDSIRPGLTEWGRERTEEMDYRPPKAQRLFTQLISKCAIGPVRVCASRSRAGLACAYAHADLSKRPPRQKGHASRGYHKISALSLLVVARLLNRAQSAPGGWVDLRGEGRQHTCVEPLMAGETTFLCAWWRRKQSNTRAVRDDPAAVCNRTVASLSWRLVSIDGRLPRVKDGLSV